MTPVTSGDSFEGQTTNLHEEGLYSTKIFGRVGTDERDNTESYIDTVLPIFNPTYFKALISLKGIYGEIIKGKVFATWDPVTKDFIKSNPLEGDTGFAFFMSHFGELDPAFNDSFKRTQKISVIKKYFDRALHTKIPVYPAGLRDIDIGPTGIVTENEVNDLYRKLFYRSKSLNIKHPDPTDPVYDNIRWGEQEALNNIADYFFGIQEGKRGVMQRKVARRSIHGATRNVIVARKVSVENMDDNITGDPNSTIIGLYQALLGFSLVVQHELLNGFLTNVFTQGITSARLVDPKTLESVYVDVDPYTVDKYTSADGIVSLCNGFSNPNLRNKEIKIHGHYLGLVYDDGERVALFHDINDLDEKFDRKYVKPVTYMEFFYMQVVKAIEDNKMLQITRYPITGIGSIFPSKVFIKPTNATSSKRTFIDIDGSEITQFHFYPGYTKQASYFDGMSIANIRLELAGGDFDGDQLSANSIMASDSVTEIRDLFGKRIFYISGAGDFLYSPVQEPHEFLLRALTNGLS